MTGWVNPVHILIVIAVALIVFGPKRLPEVARKLGASWRELRDALGTESNGSRPGPPVLDKSSLMLGGARPSSADPPRTGALGQAAAGIVTGPGESTEPRGAAASARDAGENANPPKTGREPGGSLS